MPSSDSAAATTTLGAADRGAAAVRDGLAAWASDRGDAPAVSDAAARLSYTALAEAALAMAEQLRSLGLGSQSRVVVMPDISVDMVVTYWALRAIGATAAYADPGARQGEVDYFLERAHATHVLRGRRAVASGAIIPPSVLALRLPETAGEDRVWRPDGDQTAAAGAAADAPTTDGVVILFSSGTTGQPKAIVHTPDSILGLHRGLAQSWTPGPGDVVLGALPFHTIYGLLFSAGTAIHGGAHLVLLDRFHPGRALEAIERERVTTAAMVPAMLLMMLGVDGKERFDLSSLEMLYSASAPISDADVRRFKAFSGAEVLTNYGMTEIPGSVVEKRGQAHRADAVGQVTPGYEAVARDDTGRALPPGETGEITLRGPSRMAGYLDDPDRTAARIRDGWVYTDDLGRVDAEGYVFLSGRRSDMIIRGGLNISPIEIAGVLARHEAVADVAVVGAPDPVLGQVPVAVVVPRGPADAALAETLRTHCADHLSKAKVPARIVFRETLPRNDGGKVLSQALLAEIADGAEEAGA